MTNKKVGVVLSFVMVLILMISIISAFSLTGMVVSVDSGGWIVDVVSRESVSSEPNLTEDMEEVETEIEKDNSLEVEIDEVKVEVKLKEDGTVEIDDGVKVETTSKIKVEEGSLSVEDDDGDFVKVKILATEAVNSFVASGEVNSESEVELEVEDGVPYYNIETKKKVKILWIIPSTKTVNVRVNAQTGEEISDEREGFFSRLFGGLFGEDEPDAVRLISPGKLSVSEEAHVADVLAMMESIEDEREDDLVDLVEGDLPEPVVLELVEPVFDKVYNPEIDMGSERDCAILTQAMIDASNGSDIELDSDGGCIAMENNLNMTNKALILRGGFTFDCQDNYLAGVGDYGIVSYENTFVQNCIVEDRNVYGFYLSDSSSITDSTANYNNRGFQVQDFSSVTDSTANYNLRGFYLYASSTVTSSTSNSNYNNGFELSGSSIVTDSIAQNNVESGFILHINGSVTDSLAENNSVGFRSYNVGTVTDSIANGNSNVGFYLVSSSSVTDSTANDNSEYGFYLSDSSSVTDSTASDNDIYGFYLSDSSSVTDSTASDNSYGFQLWDSTSVTDSTASDNYNGFSLHDSSSVTDSIANNNHGVVGFVLFQLSSVISSTANNNNNGFNLYGSSFAENIVALDNQIDGVILQGDSSSLLTGITSCGNGAHDIFSNFGIIDGTFYTENVGGVWNGDLNVRDCKYRPESNMDDFDLS